MYTPKVEEDLGDRNKNKKNLGTQLWNISHQCSSTADIKIRIHCITELEKPFILNTSKRSFNYLVKEFRSRDLKNSRK